MEFNYVYIHSDVIEFDSSNEEGLDLYATGFIEEFTQPFLF